MQSALFPFYLKDGGVILVVSPFFLDTRNHSVVCFQCLLAIAQDSIDYGDAMQRMGVELVM